MLKNQKLRNLLAIGILGANVFTSCRIQRESGALIDKKISYLTDSRAEDKVEERKIRIDRKYGRLMKLNDKERIKLEIQRFGDYEFGDKNGDPSFFEEKRAYEAFLDKWRSEYKRSLRDMPFIEVLIEYRGY